MAIIPGGDSTIAYDVIKSAGEFVNADLKGHDN